MKAALGPLSALKGNRTCTLNAIYFCTRTQNGDHIQIVCSCCIFLKFEMSYMVSAAFDFPHLRLFVQADTNVQGQCGQRCMPHSRVQGDSSLWMDTSPAAYCWHANKNNNSFSEARRPAPPRHCSFWPQSQARGVSAQQHLIH